ncbi:MAG: hypothetical protein IBX55_01715 [Methyloprofundus sp.]|nr:hypothetical protein [Methyloprofundus sp.]
MNTKIKVWCEKNMVKVKELAGVAGVSEKTVYNFFNGSEIKSGAIEAWAKEWPEMICYALDLQCDGVSFIPQDDDESARLQSIIDKQSERIAALEWAVAKLPFYPQMSLRITVLERIVFGKSN